MAMHHSTCPPLLHMGHGTPTQSTPVVNALQRQHNPQNPEGTHNRCPHPRRSLDPQTRRSRARPSRRCRRRRSRRRSRRRRGRQSARRNLRTHDGHVALHVCGERLVPGGRRAGAEFAGERAAGGWVDEFPEDGEGDDGEDFGDEGFGRWRDVVEIGR